MTTSRSAVRNGKYTAAKTVRQTVRQPVSLIGPVVVIALIVSVWGGYGLNWDWTGFRDNKTLWDWLHLFILPVSLAVLALGLRTHKVQSVPWRSLLVLLLAAGAVLLIGGYGLGWKWTGFEGNELWDWLHLMVLPVVVVLSAARDCWTEVAATPDGRVLSEGTLDQGQVKSIPADGSLWLRLGAPKNVSVTLNGSMVQLPQSVGSPYDLTFSSGGSGSRL